MKSGKTLQELAAELERQSSAKADYVADTREMTLLTSEEDRGRSELVLPGDVGELVVGQIAHNQIATRLGIPTRYYERLRHDHPALLDQNVNTLFRRQPERRMVRTLDGNARAFLSDRYRRLDNDELAAVIFPVLSEIPDVRIESCELTERRMYIKAITPRTQADVKVGDTVQAGVVISNSEIGHGALKIQPMIFRLVCLNGMIAAEATKRYHVGRQVDSDDAYEVYRDETMQADDQAFFMKMADVVRAAVDETKFNAIVQQMRDATETPKMADPVGAMEKLSKRFDFNEGEQRSVLTHLIEGGDLTAYGFLNAVTRASQDVESYDRATELEEVGGAVLAMPAREWGNLVAA